MLRQRKKPIEQALEFTKQFDAFHKLEDDYKETSSTRGTSIIRFWFDLLYVIWIDF